MNVSYSTSKVDHADVLIARASFSARSSQFSQVRITQVPTSCLYLGVASSSKWQVQFKRYLQLFSSRPLQSIQVSLHHLSPNLSYAWTIVLPQNIRFYSYIYLLFQATPKMILVAFLFLAGSKSDLRWQVQCVEATQVCILVPPYLATNSSD